MHNPGPMNLNSLLTDTQLICDLLVQHSGDYQRHYFALSVSERSYATLNLFNFTLFSSRFHTAIDCPVDSFKQGLILKWLGEKIHRACLHRSNAHPDISMAGYENNRSYKSHTC